MKAGIFYGIGVGPGAPDLLTLRAVKTLGEVDAVFTAASPKNEESGALNIARPHLRPATPVIRLDFPMTRDRAELECAWARAAAKALAELRKGLNAAFLTLGDPLIYSTFGYLAAAIRELEPEIEIRTISGITSFQAAAARENLGLCESGECLAIISGILPETEIARRLEATDSAVILKVYRNYRAIMAALEKTGRGKDFVLASFVEQKNETIGRASDGQPPYMSLIISRAKKG